jgi:uncharacterized membrane protein YhaH (DUF805 family)
MTSYLYNLFIRNLFSFKGRASRKEYIIKFITILLSLLILKLDIEYIDQIEAWYLMVISPIPLIVTWILMLQYFPLAVRRLHDLNSSGWFVLISFIPFGQLLILWLMFKKGTDGVNDYGEPPEY